MMVLYFIELFYCIKTCQTRQVFVRDLICLRSNWIDCFFETSFENLMIEIYFENLIAHNSISTMGMKTLVFYIPAEMVAENCWLSVKFDLTSLFTSEPNFMHGRFGRIKNNSLFPSDLEDFWSTSGTRGIGGKAYESFPSSSGITRQRDVWVHY